MPDGWETGQSGEADFKTRELRFEENIIGTERHKVCIQGGGPPQARHGESSKIDPSFKVAGVGNIQLRKEFDAVKKKKRKEF